VNGLVYILGTEKTTLHHSGAGGEKSTDRKLEKTVVFDEASRYVADRARRFGVDDRVLGQRLHAVVQAARG